jgi:hypothetical protein
MSIQKKIKKISLVTLGCQAEHWEDVWSQIKELSDAFGERKVSESFQDWADSRKGEIITRPIAEFLKIAPGLIQGITSLKPDPKVFGLINDLAAISNGRVLFDREQQILVKRLVGEYTAEEVKSAFREFYGQIEGDDFLVRRAAKTFVETAEQLLTLQRRRKEEAARTQVVIERATLAEREKARQEQEERQRAIDAENELIEDTLDA